MFITRSRPRSFAPIALFAVVAMLLVAHPAQAAPDERAAPDGAAGEVARLVVTFRPGADPARTAAAAGGAHLRALRGLGSHVVEVPAARAEVVARALASAPGVASVEHDPVVELQRTPNDVFYSRQWGLGTVNAPAAWDVTTGSPSTIVAVLDTGVQASHPDLQGALVAGRDIVNGDNDPDDDHVENGILIGHGTMVAGIVAARTNNDIGVAGACWTCRVMPVKVLGSDGSGFGSDAAEGIIWAVDNGAQIVNLSLGSPDRSSSLERAVNHATSRGVMVIAAAGNEGTTNLNYPAAYDGVIGVAGTTSSDTRYSWSNHGSWVSVAAPGCLGTTKPNGVYGDMCGTSAAAPLVAGVAGLAFSHHPNAGAVAIRAALEGSARSIGSIVAHGRIDAAATLAHLAAAPSEPAPEPVAEPAPEPVTDNKTEPEPEPEPEPSEPSPAPAAQEACPSGEVPPHGFTDIEGNTHEHSIGCILWWEITASSSTYRPSEVVTRGQMATFIAQALEAADVSLPSVTSSSFTDAQNNIHEKRIAQLAELKIVGGYSDGTYRPNDAVTRNQMATFLVRAYETAWDQTLQAGGTSFTDIGSDAHRTNIEKAAGAGFASGTSATTFSPGVEVARAQMATFLRNVLDRAVREGFTVPPSAR